MNMPAKLSASDGRLFLQEAFRKQQAVLQAELDFAATSITHPTKQGDVTEKHFLSVLRSYLPRRYAADSAVVIDSEGHTSDQIDVLIYDPQYTPTLLDQQAHKYVTAEAVYAVLEVKPVVDKCTLDYAGEKAASVRRLLRTSVAFGTVDGPRKKEPFAITAGVIAARANWADGLGKTFLQNHAVLAGDQKLDCVLAVCDRSFDVFNPDGSATYSPADNALVFFLFRLLQKLQSLGTAAAVDWSAYANQLSRVL